MLQHLKLGQNDFLKHNIQDKDFLKNQNPNKTLKQALNMKLYSQNIHSEPRTLIVVFADLLQQLQIQTNYKKEMSNLANYSPYNKTYKFLLLQNQAYHEKNKRSVKPCIRSNLRYEKCMSLNQSCGNINPETENQQRPASNEGNIQLSGRSNANSLARSMLFSSRSLREGNPLLASPKRVIHKHESFEKFKNMGIQKANSKLVQRILSTSCQVPKREKSTKQFKIHLKYRQIHGKYDKQGNRKHGLAVGNEDLLCPTLREYNHSGLADQFIAQNLSWSKISTARPPRLRKKASNFSCQQ